MATVRFLNRDDTCKLEKFFSSLSASTLKKWNRFGFEITCEKAKVLAEKCCQASIDSEIGFVCEENSGEIVGYSYLRFFPEKISKKYVASLGIVVSDNYQGKGYGKLLMEYMHDYAKRKGLKKIWLATYYDNSSALKLYKKMGYEIEGVFMYDEIIDGKWTHVISMAYFLDPDFKDTKAKRNEIIENITR